MESRQIAQRYKGEEKRGEMVKKLPKKLVKIDNIL